MSDTTVLRPAGPTAVEYVHRQLVLAATEFSGVLARGLLERNLADVGWIFAAADEDLSTRDWDAGVPAGSGSDRSLAIAISQWLARSAPGCERLLILEDPLARSTDASVGRSSATTFGSRVFWSTSEGSPTKVGEVLRRVVGYPGVGVLASGKGVGQREHFDKDYLDHVTKSAHAVLVRACDDQAFLLMGVGPVDELATLFPT